MFLQNAAEIADGGKRWSDMAVRFFDSNHYFLAALVVLYLPLVFGGRALMAKREAFQLTRLLQVWNAALFLFSAIGAVLLTPIALRGVVELYAGGQFVCGAHWCFGVRHSFWGFAFNVSKFFEFGDTALIVLRKRPLLFLHYYHHVVTLLFCWFSNQVSHRRC